MGAEKERIVTMTDRETCIFPSTESESQRLERQGSRLYGGISIFEPFLTEAATAVLDVGCGSGYFLRKVAAAIRNGRVVGLDIDESRLSFARSQGTSEKLHYQLGDMYAMPFKNGLFDLTFCRFALVHKQKPENVLHEMMRVTKPGGRIVAYDMVHEGIWFVPDRPAFEKALKIIINVLRERGAEPNQGLFLASGMKNAGLFDVSVRVIPHYVLAQDELYEAHRDNWIATFKNLGRTLGSLLDEDLVQAAVSELKRVCGDELIVETTVLAWGRKP
jgi:SAM-dependent methyltransferase